MVMSAVSLFTPDSKYGRLARQIKEPKTANNVSSHGGQLHLAPLVYLHQFTLV